MISLLTAAVIYAHGFSATVVLMRSVVSHGIYSFCQYCSENTIYVNVPDTLIAFYFVIMIIML